MILRSSILVHPSFSQKLSQVSFVTRFLVTVPFVSCAKVCYFPPTREGPLPEFLAHARNFGGLLSGNSVVYIPNLIINPDSKPPNP